MSRSESWGIPITCPECGTTVQIGRHHDANAPAYYPDHLQRPGGLACPASQDLVPGPVFMDALIAFGTSRVEQSKEGK
jgi:hypothetical protein